MMRPSRLVLYSTLARTVHERLAESQSSQSSPNKVLPGWEFPVAAGVHRIFCSAKLHSICLSSTFEHTVAVLDQPLYASRLVSSGSDFGSDTHFSEGQRQRQKRATNSVPGFHCSPIVYPGTCRQSRRQSKRSSHFFAESFAFGP